MLVIASVIVLVWLVGALAVVGMCRSAAIGDRTEIVPSWDDLSVLS